MINYKIGAANFAILTILLKLIVDSQAFPGFTSNCSPGNPLGGPHLKENSRGPLSSYGLQLKIGNTIISEGNAATVVSGNSLPISLISTNGESFRGFQIRVSKQGIKDTSKYLAVATDSAVQVDSFCTSIGVGGLSHNSKRDKQKVEGTFKPPSSQIDGLKIEIVVVTSSPSIWYRSEFLVNVKGSLPSASPMASAPSRKPVKRPSKPTKLPTPFPTTKRRPSPAPTPPPVPSDDDFEDDETEDDDDGEMEDDDGENEDDRRSSSFWNL